MNSEQRVGSQANKSLVAVAAAVLYWWIFADSLKSAAPEQTSHLCLRNFAFREVEMCSPKNQGGVTAEFSPTVGVPNLFFQVLPGSSARHIPLACVHQPAVAPFPSLAGILPT